MKAALPVLLLSLLTAAPVLRADEGMWTYDNLPLKQLKTRYGFEPTQTWLDHLRLASVRFNDGGSGSFVSAEGLVLTNHHVARGQLQKVSTPQMDYVQTGFMARTRAEELACPDLELNVLVSMENVTDKVMAAAKPGMAGKDANDARKATMGRLEKESLDATGLRSDVVSLYQGGEYWLYRYHKYTDIRLVFAPEVQAAFFGGDPDNFTFPRHDLDMALFRVYEHGQPVRPKAFLNWNRKGAANGDLVFISGHPGRTERLDTLAQITYTRDTMNPLVLGLVQDWLDLARAYGSRGKEEARQANGTIFGLENALKVYLGRRDSLKVPALLDKKAREEAELRRLVAADPALKAAYADAWDAIAEATRKADSRIRERLYRSFRGAELPGLAAGLVQYVAEVAKPDAERLEAFHAAGLESLRFRLLSPAPVYPAMEAFFIEKRLQRALEQLGPQDPWVQAALGGRTPQEVAREAMAGTRLADPAVRKALLEGGAPAVAASADPLIVLARRLDPLDRELAKWYRDQVESVQVAAGEKIGQARFAVYGRNVYPDATFTLRLSFGTLKGFPMNGTVAPSKTTFHGLYDRAASFDFKAPFNLPPRFLERKARLDLNTPLDFVADGDIIGGNSGSPVVDRAGDLVGLIFDGNIESLAGDFVYDGTANRSVAVHTAGMTEALDKLYDGGFLLKELLGQ